MREFTPLNKITVYFYVEPLHNYERLITSYRTLSIFIAWSPRTCLQIFTHLKMYVREANKKSFFYWSLREDTHKKVVFLVVNSTFRYYLGSFINLIKNSGLYFDRKNNNNNNNNVSDRFCNNNSNNNDSFRPSQPPLGRPPPLPRPHHRSHLFPRCQPPFPIKSGQRVGSYKKFHKKMHFYIIHQ